MTPEMIMAAAFADELEKIAVSAKLFRAAARKRVASIAGEASPAARKLRAFVTERQLGRMSRLSDDIVQQRYAKSEALQRQLGVGQLNTGPAPYEAASRPLGEKQLVRQTAAAMDAVPRARNLQRAVSSFEPGESAMNKVLYGAPKMHYARPLKPPGRGPHVAAVRAVSPAAQAQPAARAPRLRLVEGEG